MSRLLSNGTFLKQITHIPNFLGISKQSVCKQIRDFTAYPLGNRVMILIVFVKNDLQNKTPTIKMLNECVP